MVTREYSFITDINHKSNKLFDLLKLLNNPSILMSKNIYNKYNTVFKYTYILNNLISEDEIRTISNLINQISYIPLLLPATSTINTLEIRTFLPEIINKYYNIYPENIQQITSSTFTEFSFYLNDSQIYIPNNFSKYIDLSIYDGYSFIGCDELIPMILSQVTENLDIKLIDGFYCIKTEDYDDWIEFIDSQKHKLRSQQVFTLKSNNNEEINSCIELAYYWGGNIKRIDNVVIIQNTIPLDMTPKAWYLINSKKILSGSIPTYRFDPTQIEDYELSERSIIDLNVNIDESLIKYYATISYLKLCDNCPELLKFIEEIKTYNDGTIELPLFKYEQFKNFISIYNSVVSILRVSQLKVKNLKEGLSILYNIETESFDNAITVNKVVPNVTQNNYNNKGTSLLITNKDEMFIFSSTTELENIDIKQAELDFDKFLNDNNLTVESSITSENSNFTKYNKITKLRKVNNLPLLSIKDVNIYKDEIQDTDSKVVSYNVGISEDNFLLPVYNAYYILDSEQRGYSNELMISEQKDMLFINEEVLQPIYEGKEISDEVIRKLWKNGEFMKEWNKLVYKDSALFSRLKLAYYMS